MHPSVARDSLEFCGILFERYDNRKITISMVNVSSRSLIVERNEMRRMKCVTLLL